MHSLLHRGVTLRDKILGNPVLRPVADTGLMRVTNTRALILQDKAASRYYLFVADHWKESQSLEGPWSVAASPEIVNVGYTPGYVGSYVSSDNVVVYGTGWPYSPWIGSAWYGAPATWGFGFSFVSNWWNPYPWYPWRRVAWASPLPCFRP